MEELDKLKRAQMHMEQLAQGINPLTGEEVPGDSVLYSAEAQRFLLDHLDDIADARRARREEG